MINSVESGNKNKRSKNNPFWKFLSDINHQDIKFSLINKKAASPFENIQTMIFFTVMMFAVSILVFTFTFLLNSYETGLTSVPGKFRAEVLSLRFTNNADCFAYQDLPTQRLFTGVIDLSKFNDLQLALCYKTNEQTGKDELNFRLQLESNPNYSVKTNNYFNVDTFTLIKEVIIKDGTNFKKDKLLIYVQDGLI